MLAAMCCDPLFRMIWWVNPTGWLLAVLLGVGTGWSQTSREDFSSFVADSDAGSAWEPQATGWNVVEGGYEGTERASVWRAVPWATGVSFACDVTVLEELAGDWLTAGIGLQIDDRNYWALNLVTAPEAQQRKHTTEMQEMLDGVWLAQVQAGARLEMLPIQGSGFQWRLGQTYRLVLNLTATNITGQVYQGTNTISGFGYRLDSPGPAVRMGRPMVCTSGLRARFDNAVVKVSSPASGPPAQPRPAAPWISRPGNALAEDTGFFRTLQVEGRWWLLDPEGKPFFDIGTDHVSYRDHWCEALGYAPYNRNVATKYGSEAAWAETTLARLKSWGFNCLPAGHSPSLRHQGLAHIEFASFGASFARREWICRPVHWTGFPDVFSPRWESHCRILARRLAKNSKADSWCIGTFLDNELEWYGKGGHLVDEVFQLPAHQAAKKALYRWLLQRFQNLTDINSQFGMEYVNEADFLQATNTPPATPALTQTRDGFLEVIAERYFQVASEALRQADPDHLVLGCRFAGQVPGPVLAAAGKFNDVFTLNTYPRVDFENTWLPDGTGGVVERVPQQVSDYYATVQKPMIITEWSFPALDSGLPCKHGAGMRVDTQEQKAACYRIFANMVADLPFMVNYHYFMWVDEPTLSISSTFPEDSNYGLVNEHDEAYALFTKTVTEVNSQAAQRHAQSGSFGLLALTAGRGEVTVQNTNTIGARQILVGPAGARSIQCGRTKRRSCVCSPRSYPRLSTQCHSAVLASAGAEPGPRFARATGSESCRAENRIVPAPPAHVSVPGCRCLTR